MEEMNDPLKKAMADIERVADCLESSEKKLFQKARKFAVEAHRGQLRKSGDPYIIHPLRTAVYLWNMYHDLFLAIAGLLHDTVEDCENVDRKTIYSDFGAEIGFMVDAVSKNKMDFFQDKKMVFEDKVERLLWAGMRDARVLILKIADRADNLETIGNLPENRQIRMVFETQAIFEPLKDILATDKVFVLSEVRTMFVDFLKREGIKDAGELKKYLYSQFFDEFTNNTYNLVYEGSDKIVWEFNDKGYYEELCKNKDFASNHEMLSMWADGRSFSVQFRFKKGCFISRCPHDRIRVFSCQK